MHYNGTWVGEIYASVTFVSRPLVFSGFVSCSLPFTNFISMKLRKRGCYASATHATDRKQDRADFVC
jgi:hypothetical protein